MSLDRHTLKVVFEMCDKLDRRYKGESSKLGVSVRELRCELWKLIAVEDTHSEKVECCEWWFNDPRMSYETKCGTVGAHNPGMGDFCPYCGKPIKEV